MRRGVDAREREARQTIEYAAQECAGKTRALRASSSASRGEAEGTLDDLAKMGELLEKLRGLSDTAMMRSALGTMDGLKAALRMPRVNGDEAKREVCVATLFGLSKLATAAREDMMQAGIDSVEDDGLLEVLRVQCKAPSLTFQERAQYLLTYVEAVANASTELPNLDVPSDASTSSGKINKPAMGGLARAFASQQQLEDLCTPEVSDEEDDSEPDDRRSLGSLCASPSKIFYNPEILSGKGVVVNEAGNVPVGKVICRVCERPIPTAEIAQHNEICAGYRPSSYGSSGCASPKISASMASPIVAEDVDQVSIDDFRIIKLISGGAYGRVFLAQKRATGDLFAVKAMRKTDLLYKNMMDQVVAERDALIAAANPFTIKLYYSFTSARHIYLVTEYANGGDLYSLLAQLGRLNENHARQYCAEITLALEYVHSRGITHRDLKPGNCLIASDGHIKLADFGLSRIDRESDYKSNSGATSPSPNSGIGSPMSPSSAGTSVRIPSSRERFEQLQLHTSSPIHRMTLLASMAKSPQSSPARRSHLRSSSVSRHDSGAKGTPDYLAPEILLCEPCGTGVDWWALGVMAYEMLVGAPPFNASTPLAIFSRVIDGKVEWPSGAEEISDRAQRFVEALLVHDAEVRLGAHGADEVKAHEWFAAVEWKSIYDGSAPSVFVPKPVDLGDTSYFVPASDVHREYPSRARRMSESSRRAERVSTSAESMSVSKDELSRPNSAIGVMQAEDADEEQDGDSLLEFTYTNLAELALRNMDVSVAPPSNSTRGLPRRGSIGKNLGTHSDK